MARSSSGLRERLLASALRLFVQHGYRGTSLADIAADVGCSKASLLYHFSNKKMLLAELLLPASWEASKLIARLEHLDGRAAAIAATSGFADLSLRFRREIKLLFDNLGDLASLPELGVEGVEDIGEQLIDAMAGRSAEPDARVAALMALSGIFLTSAAELPYDDETLREAMTAAALRTLGRTGA